MKSLLFFISICYACTVLALDCTTLSAVEIRNKIKNGDITSKECILQYYQRIDALDEYNAFINTNKSYALQRAQTLDTALPVEKTGLLYGVPYAIKDNILTKHFPTSGGTEILQSFQPQVDAPVVALLNKQGAVLLGKTNMTELAGDATNRNPFFGPVRNPLNKQYISGGSSGGSAVAVALHLVPFALGTDTAGSIRIPAALSGVIGFRPTTGRYPMEGIIPVAHSSDTVGILANNMDDVILVDKILSKHLLHSVIHENKIKTPICLGIPKNYFFDGLDPSVKKVVDTFLDKLRGEGIILKEIQVPNVEKISDISMKIVMYEGHTSISDFLAVYKSKISFKILVDHLQDKEVKAMYQILLKGGISKAEYHQALLDRANYKNSYHEMLKSNNIEGIIFPTTRAVAKSINSTEDLTMQYIANTLSAVIAQVPGISFPIGLTPEGLPVGIEVDGKHHQDDRLLTIVHKLTI